MSQAVIGIVSDLVRTDHLVKRLNLSGFGSGKISVLGPNSPLSHIRCEKHSHAAECALISATAGGGLGAILGFVIDTTNPPELVTLQQSAPLVLVLCGIAVGTIAGIIVGGLVGLFSPKYEAKQFVNVLSGGNILVSVHVDDKREECLVKDLFEAAQAENVQCIEEQSDRSI